MRYWVTLTVTAAVLFCVFVLWPDTYSGSDIRNIHLTQDDVVSVGGSGAWRYQAGSAHGSFLLVFESDGYIQGKPDVEHRPLGQKGLYFYSEGTANGHSGRVEEGYFYLNLFSKDPIMVTVYSGPGDFFMALSMAAFGWLLVFLLGAFFIELRKLPPS